MPETPIWEKTEQSLNTTDYHAYPDWWRVKAPNRIFAYTSGKTSFVQGLLPEKAVALHGVEAAQILYDRLGEAVFMRALQAEETTPSPAVFYPNGSWLKRSRTVGINVRTIGNFFNIVKYALTLPAHIDCIHLLPIWEPGVVASLYGMASWRINPEFFSHEMVIQYPHLNTVEAQLKVVINLLHGMGKKVGMDVIPHTDRYAEMVIANPSYFEWLRREDTAITDHSAGLCDKVEDAIYQWLRFVGAAIPYYRDEQGRIKRREIPRALNQYQKIPEEEKLILLFGQAKDQDTRRERRIKLVDHLYRLGYEPVPATMAPPYRGLEVDPNPEALTVDDAGRRWRDYRITEPTEMSRVFGPLTRYQLYARIDDNRNWEIDFENPRPQVWNYVAEKYSAIQRQFGFDFMRGDMSHVQMRPEGTPAETDAYYDLLAYVKAQIARRVPHFAYFAESFLAPPDYMAYGSEEDHLEASEAEVTLGNLQSLVPGSEEFLGEFSNYLELAKTRTFSPAFTVITGDKDDPRFDKFYLWGMLARYFTGLFLTDLPTYYSLGFEQRDLHPYPAPNEHYTKLYVFQLQEGPKATSGPYRWGQNMTHFWQLDRLQQLAEGLLPKLDGPVKWWLTPDKTGVRKHICWSIGNYLFVVNFGSDTVGRALIPGLTEAYTQVLFSTLTNDAERELGLSRNGLTLDYLRAGEGLILSWKI